MGREFRFRDLVSSKWSRKTFFLVPEWSDGGSGNGWGWRDRFLFHGWFREEEDIYVSLNKVVGCFHEHSGDVLRVSDETGADVGKVGSMRDKVAVNGVRRKGGGGISMGFMLGKVIEEFTNSSLFIGGSLSSGRLCNLVERGRRH